MSASAAPDSMAGAKRVLAERGGNFLQTAEQVMVQADDLGDDDIGVFAILRERFHHRAK